MILLPEDSKVISKPEQELVEQEKEEYKLLGTYLRTKGLKMFYYSPQRDELGEVNYQTSETIHMVIEDGRIKLKDPEQEKAMVDSRNIHFEALNLKNAKKRLMNYKQGKIKELCNLREYNPDGINFW